MNFINPTYRITFSIGKTEYIMDVKSRVDISIHDLSSFSDEEYPFKIGLGSSGKFDVTVSYKKSSGLYGFEDYKEFDSFFDLMSFIEPYRQQANPTNPNQVKPEFK